MNFRNRIVILVAALMLMVGAVPALAQDTFGLSGDDFALWTQANAMSAAETNFGYTFEMPILLDDGMAPIEAMVYGEGVIGFDVFTMNLQAEVGADSLPLSVIFVDNMLYIDLTAAGLGWVSAGEADMAMLSDLGGAQLGFDPAALAADPTAALPEEAMNDLFAGMGTFDINSVFSVTRQADAEGDAVFYADVDLAALAASDLFTTAFAAGMASSDDTITYEDAKAQAAGMMMLAGPILENSELSYTQYIADGMVNAGSLVLFVDAQEMAGVVVDLSFNIGLEYGVDTSSVAAPEGAMPLADLLAGMGM